MAAQSGVSAANPAVAPTGYQQAVTQVAAQAFQALQAVSVQMAGTPLVAPAIAQAPPSATVYAPPTVSAASPPPVPASAPVGTSIFSPTVAEPTLHCNNPSNNKQQKTNPFL